MLSTEFSCFLPSILVVIMSPTFNIGQENLYFGWNVWQKHFRWPPMGALLMDSSHKKMDGFWSLLKLGANSIALQHIRKSLDCGRWKNTHQELFKSRMRCWGWVEGKLAKVFDTAAKYKRSESHFYGERKRGREDAYLEWTDVTATAKGIFSRQRVFFHVKGYFFTAKGIFSRQRVNCATQPLKQKRTCCWSFW